MWKFHFQLKEWTLSSVVERFVHIEEAVGPNPTVSTRMEAVASGAGLNTSQKSLQTPVIGVYFLAAGKVYTAKTGEGATEILKKLEKTHPDVVPEIAYFPKVHSLI